MPFAITVSNLIEIMKEPGCPICLLEKKAARKAVEVFLWENLMDPSSREQALAAYGFCPPHTRLMAAAEQTNSGAPIGVNILYEVLNRRASRELKSWPSRQARSNGLSQLLKKIGIRGGPTSAPVLPARARCPICVSAEQSSLNTLLALFEELERGTPDITLAYEQSDGVCLAHLRLGVDHLSGAHPKAARWLVELAEQRLAAQADLMKEFIRKKNWEYREEHMTPAEWEAWRHALAFYTGYPADSFTFDAEES